MDAQEIIETLCSRGHRGSCTKEEHWAASEIGRMFGDIGFRTEQQEFTGHVTFGSRLLIHIVPALVLSLLVVFMDHLALVFSTIMLFLVLSFIIESFWFVECASRFTSKGSSVNVIAREERPEAEQRILITAHHDSQRVGRMFDPKFIDMMKQYVSPTSTITPIHLTFLTIVGLAITTSLFFGQISGSPAVLLGIIHLMFIVGAAGSTYLVYEWTTSTTYSPGANDNASGVAVMLRFAQSIAGERKGGDVFDNTEFWFVSTGCEETGTGGARAFIKDYSAGFRDKPICVICLDGLGYGKVHYLTADGMLVPRKYDHGMIRIARRVMRELLDDDRPLVCRAFTDGAAFTSRAFPTITFGSLDEENLIANYHWHTDTPENINPDSLVEAEEFLMAYVKALVKERTVS